MGLQAQHYPVEIEETGVSQLIIFLSSISNLDENIEIGIYDLNGLKNSGDCENEYGEVLVGSGLWVNEQLDISIIGSYDNCSIEGGNQKAGFVSGNTIIVRIWDFSKWKEYETTLQISEGNDFFSSPSSSVISELNNLVCIYNCDESACSEGYDCLGECGGAAYFDECGVCDSNGSNDCVQDCDQVWGGDAVTDNCGTCDDDPSNNCIQDCAQEWGGAAVTDECGVCDGPGIPEGECDCAGNVNLGCGCGEDAPSGCDETCGSILENDLCGVCDGPGSTYECGCADIPAGECDCVGNVWDECGVCGGESSCAVYIESSVTINVDESDLADLETFAENLEAFIETALDLPQGTVEVISIDGTELSRSATEIEVEFTITLTEVELAMTNFNSVNDIIAVLEMVETEIEVGGIEFIYGCTDSGADNYDENATIDNDTCTYLAIYQSEKPEDYYLYTYPNPFNPITSILFSIPQMGIVSIKAYDIMGRELKTLSNRNLNPGNYSVNWDASGYPSGVYFVKMVSGEYISTQKLMLVK